MIIKIIQDFPHIVVTAVITTLITLLRKQIVEIIMFVVRRLRGEGKRLEGKWYLYIYCHLQDNYSFNEIILNIKLSLSKNIKYKVESTDSTMYPTNDATRECKNVFSKYSGYLKIENTYLNLLLHSNDKNYRDTTFHKYLDLFIDGQKLFFGVYASTHYNLQPCCGVSILSRHQITKDRVDNLIKKNYSRLYNLIYVEKR